MNELAAVRLLKFWHLAHFSQPATDRPIYYGIRNAKPRRVLELGIANLQRTQKFLKLAGEYCEEPVEYIGVDPFESARKDFPLKAVYQALRGIASSVRLVPGDGNAILPHMANMLPQVEALLISQSQADQLDVAWYYLPRLLSEKCLVLIEKKGQWQEVEKAFVQQLADEHTPHRRNRRAA